MTVDCEFSISNKTWIPGGTYTYSVKEENGLYFLYMYAASKPCRYLLVNNDEILLLYDSDNSSPLFFGYSKGVNKIQGIYYDEERWFEATSSLKENGYEYKASNMALLKTK